MSVYKIFGVFPEEYVPFETPPFYMGISISPEEDFNSLLDTGEIADVESPILSIFASFYDIEEAKFILDKAIEFYGVKNWKIGDTNIVCDRCHRLGKGRYFIKYHKILKLCKIEKVKSESSILNTNEINITCPNCQKKGNNDNGRFAYYHLIKQKCLKSIYRKIKASS